MNTPPKTKAEPSAMDIVVAGSVEQLQRSERGRYVLKELQRFLYVEMAGLDFNNQAAVVALVGVASRIGPAHLSRVLDHYTGGFSHE